jgi:PTS system ascorbate-specific IIA component
MARLFIIAHAPLASALKSVAEHAFPDATGSVAVLDVTPGMSPDEIESRARGMLGPSSEGDVLIMTDAFGATPCNVAQRLADGFHAKVVTGVNVPMLWRALCYAAEPLESLVARALAGATQGVMQVATVPPQNQAQQPAANDQDVSDDQQ